MDNKVNPQIFLTAHWRYLVMINYEVDPSVLIPFVPKGTQIDLWKGKAFVSLVGFMFLDTRVRGISYPFHRNFEEVNLRFYIKCHEPNGEVRRGVVFIKEIVPRWGIAYLARRLYNENYVAYPMRHLIEEDDLHIKVKYEWKFDGKWQKIGVNCKGDPQPILKGSDEEFITEHYWGYTAQRDGETKAYLVEHPLWGVWKADHCEVDVDMKGLYGPSLSPFLEKPPVSSFLVEGSDVKVFKGSILP